MLNSFRLQMLLCLTLMAILAGCRTPPAPPRLDPEIERQVAAARGAYAAGAIERAAAAFEMALQRARLIDDSPEIARCAYNLAACLATLQQWDAAGLRLDEAQAACGQPEAPPVEFTILRAKIARGAGRPNDAMAIARAWLDAAPVKSNPANRRIFQVFLATLLYDTSDYAAARDVLAQIPAGADKKEMDILTRADFYRLQARLAWQADSHEAAARLFDDAAAAWRAAGRYRIMADCLADAGRAWAAAGDLANAADRMYRAARSLHEQDQPDAARALAREAMPLAASNAAIQTLLQPLAADPAPAPPSP